MTRRMYVAGPMRGYEDDNKYEFEAAERFINQHEGWVAFIPADIDPWDHSGECPGRHLPGNEGKPHTECCYFRGDLLEMLDKADAVTFLPGWEMSVGARLEHMVAAMCGLPIYYWNPDGNVVRSSIGETL